MPHAGSKNRILRKAFEGIIELLGPSGEQEIVSNLRSKCDYEREYLDSKLVRDTLVQFFGPYSAGLLLEAVAKVETRYQARLADL